MPKYHFAVTQAQRSPLPPSFAGRTARRIPVVFITATFCFLVVGKYWPPRTGGASALSGADALARCALAFFASVTFVLGPGLALRAMFGSTRKRFSLAVIALPGAALLAVWGLLIWTLRIHHLLDLPRWVAAGLLCALTIAYLRRKYPLFTSASESTVLVLYLLVIIVSVGKGLYSQGPVGELYLNLISRTTEVGGRSDSRIPFNIVELVANGLTLNGAESRILHAPYLPTSRGPITGLTAAPIVILSGANVPTGLTDLPWSPFDSHGFQTYRIFMACLAATGILTVFGLAAALANSEGAALFSASVLALSPFFIHELYFTWPKLYAGTCVLASLYATFCRQPVWAGLLLGFAFLVHPLALLSLPLLLLGTCAVELAPVWTTARWLRSLLSDIHLVKTILYRSAIIAGMCGLIYVGWNSLSQAPAPRPTFPAYILLVDGKECTSANQWLSDRAISFLNTVVPFYLYVFHSDNWQINSIWGPSPPIVRLYFSYWTTLPFAIGIVIFFPWLWCMTRLARRFWLPFVVFIAFPFIAFAIYWGGSESGLMREGLHPWFLTLFVWLAWGFARAPEIGGWFSKVTRWLQTMRRVELLGMLLAPTLWTNNKLFTMNYAVTDLAALALMVIGTGALATQARRISSTYFAHMTNPQGPRPVKRAKTSFV
jgi:hypothetical protein